LAVVVSVIVFIFQNGYGVPSVRDNFASSFIIRDAISVAILILN